MTIYMDRSMQYFIHVADSQTALKCCQTNDV